MDRCIPQTRGSRRPRARGTRFTFKHRPPFRRGRAWWRLICRCLCRDAPVARPPARAPALIRLAARTLRAPAAGCCRIARPGRTNPSRMDRHSAAPGCSSPPVLRTITRAGSPGIAPDAYWRRPAAAARKGTSLPPTRRTWDTTSGTMDQRHAHGPALRGHGRRSPLARRIITRAALRAFRHLIPTSTRAALRPPPARHQLTALATHPGLHPRHQGGLVAVGTGAPRRPRLSAHSPPAFSALLRLASSDPVLIVSGIQHQRVARPLCPCARPYHGP
jgi:hypothetical protein